MRYLFYFNIVIYTSVPQSHITGFKACFYYLLPLHYWAADVISLVSSLSVQLN